MIALPLSTPPETGFAAGGVEVEAVGAESVTGGLGLEGVGAGVGAGFGGGAGSLVLTGALSLLTIGSSITIVLVLVLRLPTSGSSFVSDGPLRLLLIGALSDAFGVMAFAATAGRLSV